MTKLTCILDNCPLKGTMVDFRRCERCKYFADSPKIAQIECTHPDAASDPYPERWQAIKEAVGCAHVHLVSFDQKEPR